MSLLPYQFFSVCLFCFFRRPAGLESQRQRTAHVKLTLLLLPDPTHVPFILQGVDRLFAPGHVVAASPFYTKNLRSAPARQRRAHSSYTPWSLHAGCVGASRAHCAHKFAQRAGRSTAISVVCRMVWSTVVCGVWCVVCIKCVCCLVAPSILFLLLSFVMFGLSHHRSLEYFVCHTCLLV